MSPPVGIELRHLRYFLAVIEELHFGRAAERLHIAQPPLSQAIRKLENELGVPLFHRTSRVVTPTEAGRALANEAAAVLASFDLAVAEARRAGGLTDVLRVGCLPHLPLRRLQAFLEALEASEAGARPQVTHLDSPELVRRLHNGELDVGIIHAAGEVAGLDLEPLFAGEPLGAFLPRTHPLTAKRALSPADLQGEVLVTYPREGDPALHDRVLEILEQAGFAFAGVREASSMNARDLMLAAADGLGVAIGPASLASVSAAGSLVCSRPLGPRASMPDTVVAWREDPPRHLGAVLANVRAVARELRNSSSSDGADSDAQTDGGPPDSA
jgi:DNA-binding transcriptional LysR family regulator